MDGKALTDPRVKVTQAFLHDLQRVYADEGEQCLRTLAAFAPDKFLALVARLVPAATEEPAEDNATSYQRALEQLTHRRLGAALDAQAESFTPEQEELLS